MNEQRRAPRRNISSAGTIELDSGEHIPCMVRNLSDTGAGLEVSIRLSLPLEFHLSIELDHSRRYCAVVWCRETLVGVVFV